MTGSGKEALTPDHAGTELLRQVAEQKLPALRETIERAEMARAWLEDAARCCCPTLDDCPFFDDPANLPNAASCSDSGRVSAEKANPAGRRVSPFPPLHAAHQERKKKEWGDRRTAASTP